jgi:hypothetical protein
MVRWHPSSIYGAAIQLNCDEAPLRKVYNAQHPSSRPLSLAVALSVAVFFATSSPASISPSSDSDLAALLGGSCEHCEQINLGAACTGNNNCVNEGGFGVRTEYSGRTIKYECRPFENWYPNCRTGAPQYCIRQTIENGGCGGDVFDEMSENVDSACIASGVCQGT